jgi:uncharacterized protein YbjT (DUF2867 family)
MRVVLFGATGMVGQGVLRECLLDRDVEGVVSIVRKASGEAHPKLSEIVHRDFFDFSAIERSLTGLDACFFCLGISSVGMKETDYRHVTYDLTIAAATVLANLNPQMTFIYVSGMGTGGGAMWAKVKRATEDQVQKLFPNGYAFRPAAIVPMRGIRSKTRVYQVFYDVLGWAMPLLYRWFPKYVTTTEQMGLAMLKVAKHGSAKRVLENIDINRV